MPACAGLLRATRRRRNARLGPEVINAVGQPQPDPNGYLDDYRSLLVVEADSYEDVRKFAVTSRTL
jgi:hypothetical protein